MKKNIINQEVKYHSMDDRNLNNMIDQFSLFTSDVKIGALFEVVRRQNQIIEDLKNDVKSMKQSFKKDRGEFIIKEIKLKVEYEYEKDYFVNNLCTF